MTSARRSRTLASEYLALAGIHFSFASDVVVHGLVASPLAEAKVLGHEITQPRHRRQPEVLTEMITENLYTSFERNRCGVLGHEKASCRPRPVLTSVLLGTACGMESIVPIRPPPQRTLGSLSIPTRHSLLVALYAFHTFISHILCHGFAVRAGHFSRKSHSGLRYHAGAMVRRCSNQAKDR